MKLLAIHEHFCGNGGGKKEPTHIFFTHKKRNQLPSFFPQSELSPFVEVVLL